MVSIFQLVLLTSSSKLTVKPVVAALMGVSSFADSIIAFGNALYGLTRKDL